jgi:protein-disulfide isomerase
MSSLTSWIAATATVSLLILTPASASRAQGSQQDLEAIIKQYLAAHPDEVGEIVKDYVVKHPDVFRDVLVDRMKQQPVVSAGPETNAKTAAAPDPGAAIKNNADALFRSAHQVTLGNPNGDVTMVEFFDYNCGFCKGALPAMLTLLNADSRLKIVLKEWPILGPGSVEAAHVAVAVRMQDPAGQKYLAFHRKLLGDPGPADKDKALAAAAAAGFDVPRLQRDMDSDEALVTVDEDSELARALGINGTPGYVIGDTVVPGAIGLAALKDQIATARSRAN